MKKIITIAFLFIVSLVLFACDSTPKYTFEIEFENEKVLREKLEFSLILHDENDELKNSEVTGSLTKEGSKTPLSTKTINFSKETGKATLKFDGLTEGTTYTLRITTAFEGKEVTPVEKTYTTSLEGTEANPYKISSFADFTNIVSSEPSAYFILTDNIDCGGKSFTPLFTSTKGFKGNFNGNGKTISNFKISSGDEENPYSSSSNENYGLFGYVAEGGEIYDLNLDTINIYVSRSARDSYLTTYGLLAGYNAGKISNIKVTNSSLNIKSTTTTENKLVVGGLVGYLYGKGTVDNVEVKNTTINITAAKDAVVGGVVGSTLDAIKRTDKVNVNKAVFDGEISVNISGSKSEKAETVIGGIVGENHKAVIDNSQSSGKITLKTSYTNVGAPKYVVGGLVGYNLNQIAEVKNSKSSVSFDVTVLNGPSSENNEVIINAGLLVGQNGVNADATSKINNCTYEYVEQSIIHVSENTLIKYHLGLTGLNNSYSNGVSVVENSPSFSILVQKYVLDEDTRDFVVSGDPVIGWIWGNLE